MKNTVSYIVAAVLCLMPLAAGAQALPYVASVTNAVSLSKAGADVAEISNIANAAFTNAAAIPYSDLKADFAAGYTMWQPSMVKSNIINVAGAYKLNDKMGVAAGFRYGMNPSYQVTDESGSSKGTFTPSDMQVNVGFAWRFLPYLSAGVNLGYASSSLAKDYSYGALTSDIFLMSKFSDFRAALGVSNLGTKVKSLAGVSYALPASATLGAGYGKVFAENHGVDVQLEANYYFTGGLTAAVGAEYTFGGLASVRVGYNFSADSPLPSYASVGLGAKVIGVKLDLAYLVASGDSPMKNTLALQLGYCF